MATDVGCQGAGYAALVVSPSTLEQRNACRETLRAAVALALALALVGAGLGCGEPTDSDPAPRPTPVPSLRRAPPQGEIVAMPDGLALDERGRLWSLGEKDFVVYSDPWKEPAVDLFVWPAARLADGRIMTITHTAPGMNPLERVAWGEVEWDHDGDAIAYGVERGPHGTGAVLEFVEARGAEELYWGCFRRGRDVFRSGDDYGCPQPNPRIVRGGTAPDLPAEVPGRAGEIGTCWDPVKQPVEARRLFPGCLVLDATGALLDPRILRPPVELSRDVEVAAAIVGGRILVVHADGVATLQPGNGDRGGGVGVADHGAGPPVAVDLPPVRAIFRDGIVFTDGTAAMFWSEDQLLRTLTGFPGAVELTASERDVCVRTSSREVYCATNLPRPARRAPEDAPLALSPAVFDGSRTYGDRVEAGP